MVQPGLNTPNMECHDEEDMDDATHGLVFTETDDDANIDNPPIGTFEEDAEFNESVMKALVMPDGIADVEKEMDMFYVKHGHRFSSRNECDLISMLPVSPEQKRAIMNRASELRVART